MDLIYDGKNKLAEDYDDDSTTYYKYDGETSSCLDEVDLVSKMMTLQSIDRLEHHLPRIVVEQLIADMKQRREEAQKEQPFGLLGRGSMTLEIPQQVTQVPKAGATTGGKESSSSSSSFLDATTPSQSATSTTTRRTPMSDGSRRQSNAGMSDLLNTLSSLDELLEEEFSSSEDEDDGSSSAADDDDDGGSEEEEESEDSDEDRYGSVDESHDDSEESSSFSASSSSAEDDEEEACTPACDKLAPPFYADDGVSDIEADDGLSDIGDDDLESVEQRADISGFGVHGRYNMSSSCCGGSVGSYQSLCSLGSAYNSTGHPLSGRSSNASDCFSGNSSHHRSFRKSVTNNPESEVGKLRQGRLNNRRLESDTTADDRSMSVDLTTLSTNTGENASQITEVQASHHVSAILFVDISGFTKLSRALEVEALSEIINNYFQIIVSEIKACGGDILKFAGDALIVEWTKEMLPRGQQHLSVTLLAALCSSTLVDRCSDFPVNREGKHICTLNLHCALGYGTVVGAHCGDMDRMEYLILGDSIRQIADAMDLAKLGEVVASPQAMAVLLESVDLTEGYQKGEHHTLAFKKEVKFESKVVFQMPNFEKSTISDLCQDWSTQELEDLQRRMSRYVHSVVYSDEFSREEAINSSIQKRVSMARTSNVKSGQTQSELRDVFTVFVQPKIEGDLNGESAGDAETLQLLNSIMFIVNSEVTHHKAHLRQFIVDDKGLVVIANFGLRGSCFPNMVEERAIPCISNIKTLLKTELNLECKMGATYGRAYCGVVGGHTRHEYAILGPSVNLAARLMASVSNPGILVDEVVKNKAGERPFKALPPVKAKGYDYLVKIYNPNENVRKSWKNVAEEFVGRQEEVYLLKETAKTVMGDAFASKIVFISGPYGIGKSYLLSYATQEIEAYSKVRDSGYHVSRLVFCEDDSFRPFSIIRPLFLGLLRRKLHIPSFGAAKTAGHSEKLGQKAEVEEAQLYVSLLQICLEAKIPMQYIEMFGGLIFSTKLSDIGTWSDRNRKMSEWAAIATHLVTAFLHCTEEYGLVLLALDDVSGMDEMSWKILQRLYQRAGNLLVIGTARNEFDLNINAEFWADLNEDGIESRRFQHLRMAPMKLEDVGRLACKRLSKEDSDLDETISKTVECQSRGNPLLACEILDVMYKEGDSESAGNGLEGEAVNKVEELLLNRLDELPAMDRSHLNLGSILGFSFAEADIVLVMEKYNDVKEEDRARHADRVHSSLQESVEYGILKASYAGGNVTYTFSHALWMKTIALHILDAWKDEMRALIDVATTDGDISIKYDWDQMAKIKADLSSMRQQNHSILQSICELRALIGRTG